MHSNNTHFVHFQGKGDVLTYWINGETHERREIVARPDPEVVVSAVSPRMRRVRHLTTGFTNSLSRSIESLNNLTVTSLKSCDSSLQVFANGGPVTSAPKIPPIPFGKNGAAPLALPPPLNNSVKLARKFRALQSQTSTGSNTSATHNNNYVHVHRANSDSKPAVLPPHILSLVKPRLNSSLLHEIHGMTGLHGSTGKLPDRAQEDNWSPVPREHASTCTSPEVTPLLVNGSEKSRFSYDVVFQV